jgi:hypothetical protein
MSAMPYQISGLVYHFLKRANAVEVCGLPKTSICPIKQCLNQRNAGTAPQLCPSQRVGAAVRIIHELLFRGSARQARRVEEFHCSRSVRPPNPYPRRPTLPRGVYLDKGSTVHALRASTGGRLRATASIGARELEHARSLANTGRLTCTCAAYRF